MRTLDNRGLSPPEPMVRILNELGLLEPGEELVAMMDREPMLLYPELERRGFAWDFEAGSAGHTLTIRRAV